MGKTWRKSRAMICSIIASVSLLVAVPIIATQAAAATKAPQRSVPQATRPIINYGILANSLSSMDPIQAFGKPAHEFAFLLYDALVRYDPGNAGKPVRKRSMSTCVPLKYV